MKKLNYKVQSSSGHRLDVNYYDAGEDAKALVQILHGMEEHKERYDEFACFLAEHGYSVLAHDHLGHGGSAHPLGNMISFEYVLQDIDIVRKTVDFDGRFAGRYLCFGHSMGSFLARIYASKYDVDCLIACGTGQPSALQARMTKLLLFFQKSGVPLHRIQEIITKSMSKGFDSPTEWLSYDKENQKRYIEDPLCGFPFTKEGYLTLTDIIIALSKKSVFEDCTARAILLIAGEDDPVGAKGRDIAKIEERYREAGKVVESGIYANMTHEILNETERAKVYRDVLEWIDGKLRMIRDKH